MRKIVFIILSILIITSCKKDKLTGDAKTLQGTWTWKSGWPEQCDCSRTLTFTDKGKYEIREDGKKIESGRFTYENATNGSGEKYFKVEFRRNNPLTKNEHFYGVCAVYVTDTTLSILERIGWTDQPSHLYIR